MKHGFRQKRTSQFAAVAILALVAALALAACGGSKGESSVKASTTAEPPPTAAAVSFPVTITDGTGSAVTFEQPVERIISYSPGSTEILFAIGAGQQVAAVDQFSDYPAETQDLPKLEYSDPAPEPAIAHQPDLVIMATRQEGQVDQFRSLGLRVLLLKEPPDLAGVLDHVRLLGRITGHVEEAERLAADLQRRIDAVAARVASIEEGPRVFYELTPDGFTVAPESFVGAMLTLVKARNVAEGSTTPFPQLSVETIIDANPDVILLADSGSSGGQSLETVKARPGWAGIDAVMNGRVYPVDGNIFSRPGPRIVDALELLVGILYPDLQ